MELAQNIVIGTRGSKLALWQARWVQSLINKTYPSLSVQLEIITTTGDQILDQSLAKIGGKGLFLKEIELALKQHQIDLAVHSMKDVPVHLEDSFKIVAVLERENPMDALISAKGETLAELPGGSVVGTSSLRRLVQLKKIRPDLVYKDLRGNVDTRLKKLNDGHFDAIVLAVAGLKRLGLEDIITQKLSIVPAVGQGAVGLEIRKDDKRLREILGSLNHQVSFDGVHLERKFSEVLDGSCQIPLGCLAQQDGELWQIEAFLGDPESSRHFYEKIEVQEKNADKEVQMLARKFLKNGGDEILRRLSG